MSQTRNSYAAQAAQAALVNEKRAALAAVLHKRVEVFMPKSDDDRLTPATVKRTEYETADLARAAGVINAADATKGYVSVVIRTNATIEALKAAGYNVRSLKIPGASWSDYVVDWR